MKILHKYVLKEHFGPLVFAMTALTSLLLLQYIAKRFGELVGKGLPWSVIGEFLFLSLPLTIALSLPMAVLVATLYAFSRLASENEITAMKASGVSLRNVLTPVLWAAAGVTIFMVIFNDQILPRANHKLRSLQGDIAQKKPTFALREQVINEVTPGRLYLRAGRVSQTSNVMRDITIYDVGDYVRRRTIYADSGLMTMSSNQADLMLTLYSGTVLDVPTATPQQLQRLYFKTQLVRIRGVGNEFEKTTNDSYKGEREMSVCEMERNAAQSRREFAEARKDLLKTFALAKERHVKLGKEVLNTKLTLPLDVGIGFAMRRFSYVLEWAGIVVIVSTVIVRGPLLLAYFMNVPDVLDYLPGERFIMCALIIAFCSMQVSLVLHNETLRAAFQAHKEFVRTNLFRLGWFLLLAALHYFFLVTCDAVVRAAIADRTVAVITWKIIYVCLRGFVTGWLLASWVCLFRQCETRRINQETWIQSEIQY